jgi:hypothetical protein
VLKEKENARGGKGNARKRRNEPGRWEVSAAASREKPPTFNQQGEPTPALTPRHDCRIREVTPVCGMWDQRNQAGASRMSGAPETDRPTIARDGEARVRPAGRMRKRAKGQAMMKPRGTSERACGKRKSGGAATEGREKASRCSAPIRLQ